MATTWGSEKGHVKLGINIVTKKSSDTKITVEIRYYSRIVVWGFKDNHKVTFSGEDGGHIWYFADVGFGGSKTYRVRTTTHTYTRRYSGGPTKTFKARLTDHYQNAVATHSRSWSIPARPVRTPSKPGTPSISSITGTGMKMSWSSPSSTNGGSIIEYQVHRHQGTKYAKTGTTRNYTSTSLSPGTDYSWRVRARNSAGWSSYSGWGRAKTHDYPGKPGTPSVSSITSSSAYFAWSAASANGSSINNYHITYSTSPSFPSAPSHHTGTTRNQSITGLSPGTTYYVHIRARNGVGYGDYSGTRSFTTLDTPSAPGRPVVSNIGPDTADVEWAGSSTNGGATITNYHLLLATNPGFTTGTQTIGGLSTWRLLTGLIPGTTYYLRTQSINSIGGSNYSATRTFTTLSGAKVRINGVWVDGVAYVREGGVWKLAKVHKRVEGTWVL